MSHRSQDSWRNKGRKASPRESAREEAATPSWKRSRSGPAASKVRVGRRPVGRILASVAALMLLVVLGIWIFWQGKRVNTHIVVLDLMKNSSHFDGVPAPAFLEVAATKKGQTTLQISDSVEFATEPAEELLKANALLVYLQTSVVTDADGRLLCLVKSSTPNLSNSSQFEPLSDLKASLKKLREKFRKPIVLLVDCPATSLESRLGAVTPDLTQELSDWAADPEIGGLVVMAACGSGQVSQPAAIGSGGPTAFGHAVAQALSTAAQDGLEDSLTVGEFCRFVQQQTAAWVRNHRRTSGQTVMVWPDLQDSQNSLWSRPLATNPAQPQGSPKFRPPGLIVQQLDANWKLRDQLDRKIAWQWEPQLWQSSTELLLRAQTALLNGNTALAETLSATARQRLSKLAQATNAIVPDAPELSTELHPNTGLPRKLFATLPNAGRLVDVWESPAALTAETTRPFEDVLGDHLTSYPWQAVNLEPPSSSATEQLRQQRQAAERAAAQVWGVTSSLQNSIKAAEEQLLALEDQAFTKPTDGEPLASRQADVQERWEAIRRFAEAHQSGERQLHSVLTVTESLSRWAANYPFPSNAQADSEWRVLLQQNLPTAKPDDASSRSLMQQAGVLATGQPEIVQLRSDIYSLLVATRMLASLLHPEEPETGFQTADLNSRAQRLDDWQRKTQDTVATLDGRLQQVVTTMTRGAPATRAEQVQAFAEMRATLGLTCLTASQRSAIVQQLLKLDEQLSDPAQPLSEDQPQPAIRKGDVALWQLQHLGLFSNPSNLSAELSSATAVVQSLSEDTSAVEVQQQLGKYGTAVRAFWENNGREARNAVNMIGKDVLKTLVDADLKSRGMALYDELNQSPTSRLHIIQHVQYCLLQCDRCLQSQWIYSGEQSPLQENGWYARTAKLWLDSATQSARQAGSGYGPIPDVLQNVLTQRTNRLQNSSGWSLVASPKTGDADLRDQNISEAPLTVGIATTGTLPDQGTAALRFVSSTANASSAQLRFSHNASPLPLQSANSLNTTILRLGSPPTGDCQPAGYITSVFFRGREWRSDAVLNVDPCAAAQFVVTRLPRPETAAVRVDGDDKRPIVFVLDMSGSMEEKLPNGIPRSDAALDTLGEIIDRVQLNEDNSAFLKVFGHRVKYDGEKDVINPKYAQRRNQFPGGKNLDGVQSMKDYCTELEKVQLNAGGKAKFKALLNQLRLTGPWGNTPLVGALIEALNDDLNKKPGIIIAITDGQANDAGGDHDRVKELETAMKNNPGTKIIIAAFDFAKNAGQLEILKQVFERRLKIPVKDANDQAELMKTLLDSLDPRSFTVTAVSDGAVREQEFKQTLTGLAPGNYDVKFDRIRTQSPVPLGPGDFMKLNVEWSTNGFAFERRQSPLRFVEARRPEDQPMAPNILRLMDYRVEGGAEVRVMLDHSNPDLPVQQPAEISLQLTSLQKFRPSQVRELYVTDGFAPGYLLEADDWPVDQKARVQAFWKMQRTVPEQIVEYDDLAATKTINARGLPPAKLSVDLRDNGTLEVGLTPLAPNSDADFLDNSVQNIRIEIGSTGVEALTGNERFVPDEVLTRVTRTENGKVAYEFVGQYTQEKLAGREIAFTSQAARLNGSIKPPILAP